MSTDWYPRSQDKQLHIVDPWLQVFQTNPTEWNIPPAHVTSLTTADINAKNILTVVKSGKQTAASVVACNEVFKEMETEARFIKNISC
ncbi:hypothetical protein Holit_00008 [Hollandina sp. SP2]